jgi:hypothetical protein
MAKTERKLSVEELVQIGDAIHNSHCSLIIVANKTETESESKVMFANHGDYILVRNMIYQVIRRNKQLKEIMFDALLLCELDGVNAKIEKESE